MAKPKAPKVPPRPRTRDEIIADRVNRLRTDRFVPREIALPTRTFEIGQHVKLGGLVDAFVVETRDEGRIVVLEYTEMSREQRDGKRIPVGQGWGAFWWFEVYPVADYDGIRYARDRQWRHSYIQTPVLSLINRVCEEEFRDNPDYQRGYVWSLSDKKRFIDSLFGGREVGRFIFVSYPYPDNEYEILDGKQRLMALKEFIMGRFGITVTYQGKTVQRLWHQFSVYDRALVENRMIQYVELDGSKMKRSELLEIFLEVNAAGVPQSEEHLDLVRKLYRDALEAEGRT